MTEQNTKDVRVITVSALHGAGGERIAELVAASLGWNLLDRALVEQIAAKQKVEPEVLHRLDQQVDPWFSRLLKSIWRSGYESGTASSDEGVFDCEAMLGLTKRAVAEAAEIGKCVIVGRGGQCILRDRPDTFHVFLYAPFKHRCRNLAGSGGDIAGVEAEVERIDRERLSYIRRCFNEDWYEPALYDLMLNSTMSPEAAAGVITCAIRGKAGKP
jgi:cytidylate kinase